MFCKKIMSLPCGRKIKRENETLVDDFLISMCEPVATQLHETVSFMTPNILTTIGLLFGILAIIFLLKNMFLWSVVFLWICYWFDCLDGYYARKYKMETQFGDYYDHFRDVFVVTVFIIILFLKLPSKFLFTSSILLVLYLMACQMGCQEKESTFKSANKTLEVFGNMCPSPIFIRKSRIAGCSTLIMIITIFTLTLR